MEIFLFVISLVVFLGCDTDSRKDEAAEPQASMPGAWEQVSERISKRLPQWIFL
ncbi:hypothetical protein ACFQZJ_18280 [Maribacter chungangensis]|uniref:Uncharacterized protein n=1 Tax=Maribacter chungangensis TaxID=1069117 RepID=A0ABW3B966_9FLAO